MNTNDIRPAAIGLTAGLLAFAGLLAWVELDPLDNALDTLARRRLTPQERAELDRIAAETAAERARSAKDYKSFDDNTAEGFRPELLSEPGSATSVLDLSLDRLVAECVHAEELYRNPEPPFGWDAFGHREALYRELTRRRALRYTGRQPRTEQLRIDIAHGRVRQLRNKAFEVHAAVTEPTETDTDTYPEFDGPTAANFGTDL